MSESLDCASPWSTWGDELFSSLMALSASTSLSVGNRAFALAAPSLNLSSSAVNLVSFAPCPHGIGIKTSQASTVSLPYDAVCMYIQMYVNIYIYICIHRHMSKVSSGNDGVTAVRCHLYMYTCIRAIILKS